MTGVANTSDSHSESNPQRSMCCTASVNTAESAPPAPRPTPIRIFMRASRSGYNGAAMRRGLSVVFGLLVVCAVAPPAHADNWYRTALVRQAVEPPYRTQLDDSMYARSDCGPAVLGMALADYGIDQDTLELRRLAHTYQGTWPAGRLVVPLVRFGLLPGHEDSGVRWGHYILLYAEQADGFLYQDPAMRPITEGRARWISRDQLARAMAPTYPPRQALALGA